MTWTKLIKSDFSNDKKKDNTAKTTNPKQHKNDVSTVTMVNKDRAKDDLNVCVQNHIKKISNYFLKSEYSSKFICNEVDKILDKAEDDIRRFLQQHFDELVKSKEQQDEVGLFKDL